MAMYENKGYCPSGAFVQREASGGKVSPYWEETRALLGDRVEYMVYLDGVNDSSEDYYIVDALMGAEGTLGTRIAAVLNQLIPECVYPKKGCPIVCIDVINPNQILSKGKEENGKWRCIDTSRKTCSGQEAAGLHEDERYLIVVQEGEGEVRIFLYRK